MGRCCPLPAEKRKEECHMPFSEICIYQAKPQKAEEFEALMLAAGLFPAGWQCIYSLQTNS